MLPSNLLLPLTLTEPQSKCVEFLAVSLSQNFDSSYPKNVNDQLFHLRSSKVSDIISNQVWVPAEIKRWDAFRIMGGYHIEIRERIKLQLVDLPGVFSTVGPSWTVVVSEA